METTTKTFGKAAKKMVKDVFPTAARAKFHGQKMSQYVNFYDAQGTHLGYWTNEGRDLGIFTGISIIF